MISMHAKLLLLFVMLVSWHCWQADARGLRKKPKVYNALITTDENLTSSRAYPVIQPTIHEPGYVHAPFGPFNPYTFFSPPTVRFGQPIVPGLETNNKSPFPVLPQLFTPAVRPAYAEEGRPPTGPPEGTEIAEEPQAEPNSLPTTPSLQQPGPNLLPPGPNLPPSAPNLPPSGPNRAPSEPNLPPSGPNLPSSEPNFPPTLRNLQPTSPNQLAESSNQPPTVSSPPPTAPGGGEPIESTNEMPKEQLPLSLNEYGLPPVLIPLPQQYAQQQHHQANPYSQQTSQQPINMPPYTFKPYPPLFFSQSQRDHHLLPPYDYFPNHQFYNTAGARQRPTPQEQQTRPNSGEAPAEPPTLRTLITAPVQPTFEDILNGAENKNKDVPDVPPPPIPSGSKRSRPENE